MKDLYHHRFKQIENEPFDFMYRTVSYYYKIPYSKLIKEYKHSQIYDDYLTILYFNKDNDKK